MSHIKNSHIDNFSKINDKPTEVSFRKLKKLERTPQKDSFAKTEKAQKKDKKKKSNWKNKIGIFFGTLGIAIATTVSVISGRKIGELKGEVKSLTTDLNIERSQKEEISTQLRALQETIDSITRTNNVGNEKKNQIKKHLGEIVSNGELGYEVSSAPYKISKPYFPSKTKFFKTNDVNSLQHSIKTKQKPIKTEELKSLFKQNNELKVEIPQTKEISPVISNEAFIGDKVVDELGQTTKTDVTLNYGKRINWSEQKIARDIMQNFYDGHGNTLDGVNLQLEKQANGKTKIKISGKALFEYTNLQYIGAGNKTENPYNAGGFGEGTKILVSNMLGNNYADNVKFSCADWQLVFGSKDNIMTRTLTKVDTPLQGNSIEFETSNPQLVDAIIDSINYFEHSSNPDFSDLAYDSKDFAFKILPEGQKGNLYLTQRFEYEEAGNWDNSIENLQFICRRKPDPDKYLSITGKQLPKDRDRTHLTIDDIKNLTKYFAADMSDEALLGAVKETMPLWSSMTLDTKSQAPLNAFIESLGEEMKKRKLAFEMSNEKFAYKDDSCNETVLNTLTQYGYNVLPESFKAIGVYSTTNVFENLSQHKALEPTPNEIKKIKILDQSVGVIKSQIDKALENHLKKEIKVELNELEFKIINDFFSGNANEFREFCPTLKDSIPKSYTEYLNFSANLDEEGQKEITRAIEKLITKKLKALDTDSVKTKKVQSFIETIQCIFTLAGKDASMLEYIKTLKNLTLITDADINQPRYIFDRTKELAQNTLGEAIIDKNGKTYNGHWIDREYLNTANFNQLLGTWLHEICHKSGGDGSEEFTYALTDMIRVLLSTQESNDSNAELVALRELFEETM